jgi:hypothetical protein
MGANLVCFVLGVDGVQYFVHELTGGWDGMSLLETFVTLYFVDQGNPRNSIRANNGVAKMGTMWWSGSHCHWQGQPFAIRDPIVNIFPDGFQYR